jgi:hypothetical protein
VTSSGCLLSLVQVRKKDANDAFKLNSHNGAEEKTLKCQLATSFFNASRTSHRFPRTTICGQGTNARGFFGRLRPLSLR